MCNSLLEKVLYYVARTLFFSSYFDEDLRDAKITDINIGVLFFWSRYIVSDQPIDSNT